MQIFAGKYSWDGKRHGKDEPITWFPGAYNIRIFNIDSEQNTVQHLKPYLILYSETGEGMSISEHPEKFAKHICNDFSLEMDKVLWAEEVQPGSGDFEMVVFTKSGKLGGKHFYSSSRRKPLDGEKKIILQELATVV